jgi:hypothetical protein
MFTHFFLHALNERHWFNFCHSRAWADTSRDSLLAQFDMAPSCRPALFGRTNAYASSPPEESWWIGRFI